MAPRIWTATTRRANRTLLRFGDVSMRERRLNRAYRSIFATTAGKPFSPGEGERPTLAKSYVVAFGHRSGSTLLRSLLTATASMGFPAEYLNPRDAMPRWVATSGAHTIGEYFSYLLSDRSTPNGVFGMKSIYPHFELLDTADVIEHLMGPVSYIYLEREDILRQAVSLALAHATGVWYNRAEEPGQPRRDADLAFDEQLVLTSLDRLRSDRASWESFFVRRGVEPLRLTYEQLVGNPTDTVLAVARYVGVDVPQQQVTAQSEYAPLADSINERWLTQLRERHPELAVTA
jgi:LPS sulfotransferase NodH